MRYEPSRTGLAVLLISGAVAMSGCASTILLRTDPPGADIYVDGIYHGQSPVPYTDTEIIGATHQIEARLPGYESTSAAVTPPAWDAP